MTNFLPDVTCKNHYYIPKNHTIAMFYVHIVQKMCYVIEFLRSHVIKISNIIKLLIFNFK